MTRRRLLTVLAIPLAAAGCLRERYEGPLEVYRKGRAGDRADAPGYTIDEQKDRGHERNPFLEDDKTRFPSAGVDRPGNVGR